MEIKTNEFRIVEFKEHLLVQNKIKVKKRIRFLGFKLWRNKGVSIWKTVMKNGQYVDFNNSFYTDKYYFETREECMGWLIEFKNYPIYEYINT